MVSVWRIRTENVGHRDLGTGPLSAPPRPCKRLDDSLSAMTANNQDGSQPPANPSSEPPSTQVDKAQPSSSSPTPIPNRSELLDRARHFLSSPQVIHQDHESKRRFLAEKGLADGEIQLLLREMVRRPPPSFLHVYPVSARIGHPPPQTN